MSDVQIEFNNIESLTLRQLGKDLLEDLVEISPSALSVRNKWTLGWSGEAMGTPVDNLPQKFGLYVL